MYLTQSELLGYKSMYPVFYSYSLENPKLVKLKELLFYLTKIFNLQKTNYRINFVVKSKIGDRKTPTKKTLT